MVNVDTVYQRVLALANKEQRGYINPQEFNLLANQAQMDIFEQYFYDLNQFKRIPGNNTLHSDVVDIIEEKINIFHDTFNSSSTAVPADNVYGTPAGFYRLMQVRWNDVEVEKIEHRDIMVAKKSYLTAPNEYRPAYYLQGSQIIILPDTITSTIEVNFVRRPVDVRWGYVVIGNKAVYNLGSSQNFELHASEETDLVLKILTLSGIAITDTGLYQVAATEDKSSTQQEKQ